MRKSMRNIALCLTYLGTAYHGWQMQKNLATVQQTLEKAIAEAYGGDADAFAEEYFSSVFLE